MTGEYLNNLLSTIEYLGVWGYWAILLIAFLESISFVGLIIPGTAIIVLAGFFSARGYFSIRDMVWFVSCGVILGNLLSYYAGLYFKKFFNDGKTFLKSSYLEKGKLFFNLHGGKSVFFGYFVGPMRTIVPFVSGLSKMDFKKFIFWDILGGFVWASIFLCLGFVFGQAWQAVVLWSTRIAAFLAAVLIFFISSYYFKFSMIRDSKYFFDSLRSFRESMKEGVKNNKKLVKFSEGCPAFFKFFKNRFRVDNFSGLALTLLSFSFFCIFFLLWEITASVIKADVIRVLDLNFFSYLSSLKNFDLTNFFYFITAFGDWKILSLFLLIAIVDLWMLNKKFFIIPFVVSFLGSGVSAEMGKMAIHRARPLEAMHIENSFSFPSGHATLAMAFYGFLAYFLIRSFKGKMTKVGIFLIGASVVFLVGFSRIYLGVHYFSDVLGGYLVGMLWLIIGIGLTEYLLSNHLSKK